MRDFSSRCQLVLTALTALAATPACGPKPAPKEPMILESEGNTTGRTPQPVPDEIERTRSGTISRAQLHQVLAAGVGGFLTGVEVEAYFEGRAFWGWKIQRYDNAWVDLIPGDVVVSINGKRIETPAQVQALWQSLQKADEIIVSAYRDPNPFELRFTVQGKASANGP